MLFFGGKPMNKDSRIYVAGHRGLVGSAVVRELQEKGYENLILKEHYKGDLSDWKTVATLFWYERPEYIFNCAAKAGGIKVAINNSAEMLKENIQISTNIISISQACEVKKLLNIGSSCIYPVNGQQPYREEQIGEGKTDENWSYAIAKMAGIELCRAYHRQYGCNFISAIPCNMYGSNDNFDLEKSHVIPALIRKFSEGDYTVWGDGRAKREFLYVDDFAKAAVFLMEECDYEDLYNGVVNVGSGEEIKIIKLAKMIGEIINPEAEIRFDRVQPHGVPRKLMDSSRINQLGWKAETTLEEGIRKTVEWYKNSTHN